MLTKMKYFLALCLFSLGLCASVQAQPPATATTNSTPTAATPEAQLLRALLEEVRQLRAVVQRANVNNYRARALTERLARQQTRVDTLSEEIEQLKTQIQQSLDTSRDEDELKELKTDIDRAPDAQTRAQLIHSYQLTERSQLRQREYARQETERNQARQQQLEINLQIEKAKLSEWQEQLEQLDREFDKPVTEVKKAR